MNIYFHQRTGSQVIVFGSSRYGFTGQHLDLCIQNRSKMSLLLGDVCLLFIYFTCFIDFTAGVACTVFRASQHQAVYNSQLAIFDNICQRLCTDQSNYRRTTRKNKWHSVWGMLLPCRRADGINFCLLSILWMLDMGANRNTCGSLTFACKYATLCSDSHLNTIDH